MLVFISGGTKRTRSSHTVSCVVIAFSCHMESWTFAQPASLSQIYEKYIRFNPLFLIETCFGLDFSYSSHLITPFRCLLTFMSSISIFSSLSLCVFVLSSLCRYTAPFSSSHYQLNKIQFSLFFCSFRSRAVSCSHHAQRSTSREWGT